MIYMLGPRDTKHILALDALDTQMARQPAYLTKQAKGVHARSGHHLHVTDIH